MGVLCWVLGLIAFGFWVPNGLEMILGFSWLPKLRDFEPSADAECPAISIVVPACNEADTIEPAMRSLLALDYPRLEIIAVEDRSADDTGAILERLAVDQPRLRVLHLTELPPGWLGKNHALQRGSEIATGEWLLFTDADIVYRPDALRRVASVLRRHPCDHLVAYPRLVTTGFWDRSFVSFFMAIFNIRYRTWQASWKRGWGYVGVGAFNMVRADLHRELQIHERLRMDVADDIHLGKLVKRSGHRQVLAAAEDFLGVSWATGLKGAIHVLTKNAFTGHNYSWPQVFLSFVGLPIVALWPYAGLFVGPSVPRLLCAAGVLMPLLICLFFQRSSRIPFYYALAWPVAAMLFLYIIVRSGILAERQGGIYWRDTFYPLDDLRRGQT